MLAYWEREASPQPKKKAARRRPKVLGGNAQEGPQQRTPIRCCIAKSKSCPSNGQAPTGRSVALFRNCVQFASPTISDDVPSPSRLGCGSVMERAATGRHPRSRLTRVDFSGLSAGSASTGFVAKDTLISRHAPWPAASITPLSAGHRASCGRSPWQGQGQTDSEPARECEPASRHGR